jgi:hypothetical protein
VDDEVSDMLGEWDAKLREEASAICEAHGFVTGFLEWGGGHSLVDSYELKVPDREPRTDPRCTFQKRGKFLDRQSVRTGTRDL